MFNAKYLILLIITSCSVSAAESLVVYSGRNEKFITPVMQAFTKKTGIKVTVHEGSASALVNRLRLEGSKTSADLFISNDAGSLQIGADQNLFKPIADEFTQVIEKNYKASNNVWIGLSARLRVFVINTAYKEDLIFVRSIFDLADPRLLGKLAITSGSNDSFISGLTIYQQLADEETLTEFLKGLKINTTGKSYNGHEKIIDDVASGMKMVGLVNHYYVTRYLAKYKNAPIEMLIPDQADKAIGAAMNVSGIAIIKHTQKQTAVDALLRFLVSAEGQALFAVQNNEYPMRVGVAAASNLTPLNNIKVANVPMAKLGTERKSTLELIEKVGLH